MPRLEVDKRPTSHFDPPENQDTIDPSLGSDFALMIEFIGQTCLRMLNSQDPRHWPTVLYVLLIMVIVEGNLDPVFMWQSELEPAHKAMELLIRDLSRHYYLCTSGCPILTPFWDTESYRAAVGGAEAPVQACQYLHALWKEFRESRALQSVT
jgi:hypothetical protein